MGLCRVSSGIRRVRLKALTIVGLSECLCWPVGCAEQRACCVALSCRRRRTYSTAVGVYQEQCGLRNVYMSWGAAEYLYMLLVLNQTQLPEEALFMIRSVRGGGVRMASRQRDVMLCGL
jgi:hypothetical protein